MSSAWLALLVLGSVQTPAATGAPAPITVQTTDESGVRIEVQKTFAASWAYSPLRVTVSNPTKREREWSFFFTAVADNGVRTRESYFSVSVPAGSRTTHELIVPQGGDVFEHSMLMMRVDGYGVRSPGFEYALSTYGADQASLGSAVSAVVAQAQGGSNLATVFDPRLLPSDWRGLTGLRALVLSGPEWEAVDVSAKTAVLEWVARGGNLIEVSFAEEPPRRSGLGTIRRTTSYQDALAALRNSQAADYVGWSGRAVPKLATALGWLTGFLIGYAMLIGPVNLFVLAPSGKRARLFWTMPALSVGASALLMFAILAQDGLGGTGKRVSLVVLMPEANREVVLQEQASRSGVLMRTSFVIEPTVSIYDAPTSHQPVSKRLVSEKTRHSGDWFESRRVQAQRLEAVLPARSRIERVSGAAGAQPVMRSALEDSLERLFYRDDEGRMWVAESGVAPGQSVTLREVTEQEFESWWRVVVSSSSPRVARHLTDLYWERDFFVGRAADGAKHGLIDTLSGIRWNDDVVYAGRPPRS